MKNANQPAYKLADIDFHYTIDRTVTETGPRFMKAGDAWTNNAGDDERGAVILCGGDLMCEPKMSEACFFDGEYDFRSCFKPLKQIFKDADLVLANLETIVSERFPYAHEMHRVNHSTGTRYHCNAPTAYLDALRYAGFDGFALANNHNADGGYEGIIDTLENIDSRSFMRTGMFASSDEQRMLLVEVNGIRLAVLSYTEHINRNLDAELLTAEGCDVMLNRFSEEKVTRDIRLAKSKGVEFILVYIHMLGTEYSNEVLPRQRETARMIANAGADCIIGSHMHAIQQYDTIETVDGRLIPVVYSLGNLITSDNTGTMTKRNILYRLHLERDESGQVRIADDSYIPLRTVEGTRSASYISFPVQKKYRGNQVSSFFDNAEATIAKEIGPVLQLANGNDYPTYVLDPSIGSFEELRKLTLGKVCAAAGIDIRLVPANLRDESVEYATARYTWVRKGCIYFSRYLGSVEAPEARWAYGRGAKLLVTSKQIDDSNGNPLPCVVVPDPASCFYAFNRWLKSLYPIPTLAVTGSVGKTTTKEMVYSVISKKYNTLKNSGNSNTYAAIADTIFKLKPDHEVYIQEVCAFAPGWVEGGARMLNANMCLITNIGYPHIDLYGSIENIMYDKTSLIRQLPADGVAFLNFDDERLRAYETDKRVISFAIENDADYKAKKIVCQGSDIHFEVECNEGSFPIQIHMPGEHNILNALAAFAVGRYLDVPINEIIEALDKYDSEGMRQNVLDIGGYNLYMDCYNSAPNSVQTSVFALSTMQVGEHSKRIAVLGDIPRLGDKGEKIHREVARKLLNTNIDEFILFGPLMKYMQEEFETALINSTYTTSREELNDLVKTHVRKGDVALFKAGHPMALAKTVDAVYGTSFHLADGDVLLENSHDVSTDYFKARWIDEAIEIRGRKIYEKTLAIPETTDGNTAVRRIGTCAFQTAKIENLTLPSCVTNIGEKAFSKCTELVNITFGDDLKVLERECFAACNKLETVILPEGLIEIGERAFAECTHLTRVTIPKSVGHIANDAFESCARLIIIAPEGSYAQSFAKRLDLPYLTV